MFEYVCLRHLYGHLRVVDLLAEVQQLGVGELLATYPLALLHLRERVAQDLPFALALVLLGGRGYRRRRPIR